MSLGASLLTFRGRRPDDAEFIEALACEAFASWMRRPADAIRRIVTDSGARTELVTKAGRRLGFVVVRCEAPRGAVDGLRRPLAARIDAIAVVREARGQGIGGALLTRAETMACESGAQVLALATADGNVRARSLFARHGFLPLLVQSRGYWNGEAAVELFKPLEAWP